MLNKNFALITAAMTALTGFADFHNQCMFYRELFLFPHQVAIADIVFSGTVVTNRGGGVAEFSVEELLWGNIPTSHISLRCVLNQEKLSFDSNGRYLVFAFTNNWWYGNDLYHDEFFDASSTYLSDFLSPTSKPASRAVFPDCRIMDSGKSVFNFSKFEINGTNYWPGTRSFITNFLEITRIQNDNIKAFRKLKSYFYESPASTTIPPWMLRDLHLYYGFRYHGVEPEQP